MPTLAGKKPYSIRSFPHKTRRFHLLTENGRPNPSEMDIKVVIPAPASYSQAKQCIFHFWKK